MIVDDEKAVRDMLSDAFSLKGYQVVSVGSAEEALSVLIPGIQVMFLDLKLSGEMGGLELCRRLRKDHPAASIYAITGHSSLFELADCRKAGFDDYFTKPTKLEMLYMAVEQAFARMEGENKSK